MKLGYLFNIASYALLTHIIANVCGLIATKLIYNLGDVHLYENHVDVAKILVKQKAYPFPTIKFSSKKIVLTILNLMILNY